MKLVHWPLMGGLLHLVQRNSEERTGRGRSPSMPLIVVDRQVRVRVSEKSSECE